MYGGQGANAFASNMMKGIDFVGNQVDKKQTRDIKQFKQDKAEEIYALAQQKEQQLQQQNAELPSGIAPADQQKIDQSVNINKAELSTKSAVALTGVTSANTKEANDEAIHNANTALTNNPSLAELYKMGKGDKIRALDLNNPKDNIDFTKALGQLGVTPEVMGYDLEKPEDKEAWKEFKADIQPKMSVVNGGGATVDLNNIATSTGANKRVSAKQQKAVVANQKLQEATVRKAQTKQVDKKLVEMSRNLKAVGDAPIDMERLKTASVEQKQAALETAKKVLYGQPFQTPLDEGGETKQYKGSDDTPNVDAAVTETLPNGTKAVHKKGEKDGTTETTTIAKDGTKETVVTDNQDLDKPETAKASKNTVEVQAEVMNATSSGQPVSDTYMRHLYALAGKTYPIPDKGQKIKNYEFMVANGATPQEAMKAIFPVAKTADHRTTLQKNIAGYVKAIKDKDEVAAKQYEDKFAKDNYIKDEDSTDPDVVKLNNALKDLKPGSQEYKNVQGQIKKLNFIKDAGTKSEYMKLIDAQKNTKPGSTEYKAYQDRMDKLVEKSSDKGTEYMQLLDKRNNLDTNSPTYKEDYDRLSARMNKLEDVTKSGDTDPSGAGMMKKRNDFINKHKLRNRDTVVTEAMFNEAFDLGLIDQKSRQNNKVAIKEINSLGNAMQKLGTFRKDISKDEFNKNMWEDTKKWFEAKIPKEWSTMSDTERSEILNKIRTESYGGQILADYMKSISGTAIADAEYQRLLNIFQADKYADKESYIAGVEGFTKGIEDTIANKADSMMLDNPEVFMRMRQQVQQSKQIGQELKMPEKDTVVTLADGSKGTVVGVNNETGEYMTSDGKVHKAGN